MPRLTKTSKDDIEEEVAVEYECSHESAVDLTRPAPVGLGDSHADAEANKDGEWRDEPSRHLCMSCEGES